MIYEYSITQPNALSADKVLVVFDFAAQFFDLAALFFAGQSAFDRAVGGAGRDAAFGGFGGLDYQIT